MFTPRQIRLLKIAVIGMGVILLAGFALVIGRIIYLVNAPGASAGAAATAGSATGTAAAGPPAIALPAGAVVRNMALAGNRLVLHYDAPAGAGIRIVDITGATPTVAIPIVPAP